MNKKLLLILFFILNGISNDIYAQNERDILDKYSNEFMERALSYSNRKAVKGVNKLGEKVNFITYEQIQTSKTTTDNLKSLVLTSKKSRITDCTFIYGSISLIDDKVEKGNSVFRVTSQNILNKKGETTYFKNKYEVFVINSYDKEIFDVHIEADLHISALVWKNIDLITKKYNEAYKTRTIEELKDKGIYLTTSYSGGYDETNEILLRMIMKEREAIINNILKDYNSYFRIEIPKFIVNPEQVWDEFYIDPIKYINVICENSPLLKKEE